MRRMVLLFLSLCILLVGIGCSKPDDTIGFRGKITQISSTGDSKEITILVEGEKQDGVSYDKANVTITEKTIINLGAKSKKLPVSQLKEGITVEGVFEGAVAESYPVQGTARLVRILE